MFKIPKFTHKLLMFSMYFLEYLESIWIFIILGKRVSLFWIYFEAVTYWSFGYNFVFYCYNFFFFMVNKQRLTLNSYCLEYYKEYIKIIVVPIYSLNCNNGCIHYNTTSILFSVILNNCYVVPCIILRLDVL